jgi:hypothetical protein
MERHTKYQLGRGVGRELPHHLRPDVLRPEPNQIEAGTVALELTE